MNDNNSQIMLKASRIARTTRRLVLHFDPSDRRSPSDLSRAAVEFIWLTRVYYLIAAFVIVNGRFDPLQNATPTDNLWPVALDMELTGGYILRNLTTTVAFVASAVALMAVFFPRMLIWKLGVFIYFFYIDALSNSFGFPGYAARIYVFISFALLFLPSSYSLKIKLSYKNILASLAVFWLTQALLLFTYSISGFWKVRDSGMEIFAADGMTRILIARALSDTLDIPLLLPVVAPHFILTHLMQLTVIYVQLSAIFALFRPHLHRPFGVILVLFHFGTDWILNVRFTANILVVGLFLVLSPTAPRRFSLVGFVVSLPVLGIPFRAWKRLHYSGYQKPVEQAWLIYDSKSLLATYHARHLRYDETIGELVLVNTSENGDLMVTESSDLLNKFNSPLTLKMGEQFYSGSKAIRMLALRSKGSSIFDIASRMILTAPLGASAFYALLKLESLLRR